MKNKMIRKLQINPAPSIDVLIPTVRISKPRGIQGRGVVNSGKKKFNVLPKLKFNSSGLIPAIIQDKKSKKVLMLAYMNRESLKLTLKEKRTCFYSRSRKVLWRKGETSGNIQKIKEIYYDCDSDTLLIKVEQTGPACHTGEKSCFYRKIA